MGDNDLALKNLEKLGDDYIAKYLHLENRDLLLSDWWEGLKFFFHRAFMRGRRDELSEKYYLFTIQTLDDSFGIQNNPESAYQEICKAICCFDVDSLKGIKKKSKNRRFQELYEFQDVANKNIIVHSLITKRQINVEWEGQAKRKNINLNNPIDLIMVMDVLNLIAKDQQHKNIYQYIYISLRQNKVAEISNELKAIYAIADKIAALIIRDALLLNPDITISDGDYKAAFPVDTWVKKILVKLGYDGKSISELTAKIIEDCLRIPVSPLKVAAGIWLAGYDSLNILLERCLNRFEL